MIFRKLISKMLFPYALGCVLMIFLPNPFSFTVFSRDDFRLTLSPQLGRFSDQPFKAVGHLDTVN